MVRICPTGLALVLTASLAGCRGQNVEGAWHGPVPLDRGTDCRTSLFSGGRFELECRRETKYVAQGTYRMRGDELTLSFDYLALDGKSNSRTPEPWTFTVTGGGNRMTLKHRQTDQDFTWERARP